MTWDASDDRLEFTLGRMSFGALSSEDQTGVHLTSTKNSVLDVFADDNDTTLGDAVYTTVRSRTMLFKACTHGTIVSVRGQLKFADEADMGPGVFAGVQGYLELVDDADVKSGGKMWAVDASIDVPGDPAGILTVASGGICAGLHAELTGLGTATQASGGILAGLYIDEQITTGQWGYGIYMPSGAAAYGMYLADSSVTYGIYLGSGMTMGIDSESKVRIGAAQGDTGIHLDGTDPDQALVVHACIKTEDESQGAYAGTYTTMSISADQDEDVSAFALWGEFWLDASDLTGASHFASVWGNVIVSGTSVSSTGNLAGLWGVVNGPAAFTNNGHIAGCMVDSELHASMADSGTTAGFYATVGSGKLPWPYGVYIASCKRSWYSSSALSGSSALNSMELAVTDSSTPSSGYSRSIYASHTNSGAKTGSAEVNVIAADFDATANVTNAYCFTGYIGTLTGATISRVAGFAMYIDAIAGTVTASSCMHLETNGGATTNDFISLRKHGGTIAAIISDRSGGATATYLLHFNGANAPVAANTHAIDGHALQHIIAVQIGSDAGYIPVFADIPT
jgi:hypothetical protein